MRGLEIVAHGGQVKRLAESCYLVRSQHGMGWYKVECKRASWTCECADFNKRKEACKHVCAVLFIRKLPQVLSTNPVERIATPSNAPSRQAAIDNRSALVRG
jgi:hypothetical protein